jgi:hypothetical protein
MNQEPPDTNWISYEVLEDSSDVNWNWDIPYRTPSVNVDENIAPIEHPSKSQGEIDLRDEHHQHEVQPALRASHRKRIVKSYSKDGSRHKSYPSKDRIRRGKTEQMLQAVRYRENPWSIIGPSSAPTSPFLPSTLPDSLMKQYLHQSQWQRLLVLSIKGLTLLLTDKQFPIPFQKWCQKVLQVLLMENLLP